MNSLDFSSIVIMEKDNETNMLTNELGSYKVSDGGQYITRAFYQNGLVNILFDTEKDVEDWEYSAVYDNFNESIFQEAGYEIEFVDDEYNPTWAVKFNFSEEYEEMELKLSKLCKLIFEEMERCFEVIKGREEEYK